MPERSVVPAEVAPKDALCSYFLSEPRYHFIIEFAIKMEPHLGGHGESDKILLHNINEFCQDDYGDDLLQNLKCRLVETFVTHCHSKENGFSCDSDGPKANSDHQYELFANKVIPESFLRSCLRSILHPVPIVMRSFTCIA